MQVLLKHGADPDLNDGRGTGWNPLMHAIHTHQGEAVRVLLESGANPNDPGKGFGTPLIMASGYGYAGMTRLLLDHGADPNLEGPGGTTALAAVEGSADIDRFTVGSCQDKTVRAILEHATNASLGRAEKRAKLVARLGGCREVSKLLASH
jgi:ankyrin repeat protein